MGLAVLNRNRSVRTPSRLFRNPSDAQITRLLLSSHRIAIVGLSPKAWRPSNVVGTYLLAYGYSIVPVNPNADEVLGMRSYPSLDDAPGVLDVVTVFRRSEEVAQIADVAIRIGAKALWLQLGVFDAGAAEHARHLTVVMNRCMKIEHQRITAGLSRSTAVTRRVT